MKHDDWTVDMFELWTTADTVHVLTKECCVSRHDGVGSWKPFHRITKLVLLVYETLHVIRTSSPSMIQSTDEFQKQRGPDSVNYHCIIVYNNIIVS